MAPPKRRKYPHAAVFGEQLRRRREARGWSQERLSGQAGLDRSYVSGIESGHHNPSLETMVKLARALGEPITDLLASI